MARTTPVAAALLASLTAAEASAQQAPNRLVLRQFHGEGFVNQYVQDEGSTPARVVFTSEAIENIASGCRARETYVVHGPDDIEELFELAPPGKPFDTYSRACYGPSLLCRYSDEEPPAIAADVLQLGDVSDSAIRPATRQVRWAEDW
jgi:hypothetical protein